MKTIGFRRQKSWAGIDDSPDQSRDNSGTLEIREIIKNVPAKYAVGLYSHDDPFIPKKADHQEMAGHELDGEEIEILSRVSSDDGKHIHILG